MSEFMRALSEQVLILDGAMGTMLQARGLKAGDCPEQMILDAPDVVAGVHREYAAAGARVIVSNTFGANRTKLAHYGLQERVEEINRRGIELARSAAGASGFVAGSIGPSGRFLEPVGDAGFDEMVEVFAEQVRAFTAAGADAISCETFLDIRELKAAIIACRKYSTLPVIAMMTFDDGGRTVLGTSPEAAAVTLDGLQVDVIGSNCGLGIDGMYDVLSRMRTCTNRPLIVQANAGLPILKNGETIFPATPAEMVLYHERLLNLGVRIIGGCCGTTPEHIRVMHEALKPFDQSWTAPVRRRGFVSSRTEVCSFSPGIRCAIIGERINPTGKKGYSAELREGKTAYIRREAQAQGAAGAHLLDVNCGAPGVDEAAALERAVLGISSVSTLPLVLDSSDPVALERGLKAADGKVLINSVNGEEKSMNAILPLAHTYGAAVIALCLDEQGIPKTASGRIAIARKIVARAQEYGIPRCDVMVDCLALTVSAEQDQAAQTLEAIHTLTHEDGLTTVLGVSNISFGLPCRPLISSTFFAMALNNGLSAAIINPSDERMQDAYRSAMVLLGHDQRAEAYVQAYAGNVAEDVTPASSDAAGQSAEDIMARLTTGIIRGEKDEIVALVEQALEQGHGLLEVSNNGLLPGLEEVGRRFGANKIFLPQVLLSAETMQTAFKRLKQEMGGAQMQSNGKIIMATVEGDIHDIGKNIVCTLLENYGFEVIDLGKNVSSARIVEQAVAHKVDAVGLSALMTTTLQQMEVTIDALRAAGVKVFTMVGGAVVTQDYADQIGADIYADDAMEAVKKIKKFMAQ
ncbi:MAG: homocysteine S-methyltransferase family protein [Desulfuromonadaceae bacterium]|nr:homocysteine S-methyltransferase family protein [Desulfuromonas sp.]MDY0184310.1 homocysteine S-methyltransferase family protein [Desulfuromonadaceae bacterium]